MTEKIVTTCKSDWASQKPVRKKLIHHGWGIPDTHYLREHIREMEKDPFDGVTIRVKGKRPDGIMVSGYYTFTKERWEESWFDQAFEDLQVVKFDKFTDNSVDLEATPGELDWFNDGHRDGIIPKRAVC